MSTAGRPVRVLHVLASLGVGGVETDLMNMLRSMDSDRHQFDFLLNEHGRRWFDDEAVARGAAIHRGPSPHSPVAYARHLRGLLDRGYDVVHSHLYTFSGVVVAVAARAGVPVRIAHTHTLRPRPDGLPRRGYEAAMRRLIARYATRGLAPTAACAAGLFGAGWAADPRFGIMPMGFDFSEYRPVPPRPTARAALGLPGDAKVLVHIGGYSPQKNHPFLFDVFAELWRKESGYHLAILTREPAPVAAELERRGLADAATLLPPPTPAAAALAAADLFVLPSHWEGLPVVALEAQAAGIRVLGSLAVPDEAVVIPDLVSRIDVAAGAAAWADGIRSLLAAPEPSPATPPVDAVVARYGVAQAWKELAAVYAGA